ncbi:MAG: MMPL family transporter [Bacteroidales bacterium]|nr:MMPL family transporter [Bacteroidales bacterium]
MGSKINSIVLTIHRYKWLFLAIILVMNTFLAFQLPSLKVDNSISVWFAKDDPTLKAYNEFKKQYGNDEAIITSLQFDKPLQDFSKIRQLSELLDKIQQVNGIHRVMSVLDIPLRMDNNQPVYLRDELNSEATEYLPDSVFHKIKGLKSTRRFLVQNQSCLVFYAWLDADPDIEQRRKEIHDQVYSLIDASFGQSATINQCGPGIIYDTLNRETVAVAPVMLALSYLIVLILVWFFTRRVRWVFITIAAISMSNICLFGLMALIGSKPNMVTMAIPPLIVVVGVANIIHFAKGINHLKIKRLNPESSRQLFSFIMKPLLFNALTTAGGFASLCIAKLQVTREYGLYAAIGVLLAFVHSLLFSLVFAGESKENREEVPWIKRFEDRIVSLMVFSARHRVLMYTLSLLILVIFGYGVSKLEADTDITDFFQKKHPIQKQISDMEHQLGYFYPADFLIRYQDRYWKDTAFQKKLATFQHRIDEDTIFGLSYSINDIINDSYCLVSGSREPASVNMPGISAPLWKGLTRSVQGSEYFSQLVGNDKKTIRITISGPVKSAKTYVQLTHYLERTAHEVFGEGLTMTPAGNLPLYSQSIDYTTHDQMTSLGLAIIIIVLLIGILLRSVRLSLIAIPSNLIPIVFILGFMGFLDVRLDLATVTIAAAILGIIVDDTIHLLYGYKKLQKKEYSQLELIRQLAHQKGPALVFASIILCSGFIVIGLAGLKSIARPGWLISLAVFVALITDLFLIPALLIQAGDRTNK